jgi:hypothetical protein
MNLEALQFHALRNAYYHTARQQHLAALHRRLMFFIILCGTAGVSSLLEAWIGVKWLAAATSLLAALDLVLDLRSRADAHSRFRSQYYLLLAETKEVGPQKTLDAKLAEWDAKLSRITAEEPGDYRVVDCIAHNNAIDTLGSDSEEKLLIPFWRTVTAHYHPAARFSPPTVREAKQKKSRS